jgi:lipopolysaccharide export LptBFGC system permease protein LptF
MDTMSPSTNNKETQRVNANRNSHLARSFIALFQWKQSSSLLSLALAIVAAIVLLVLVHGVFPKWSICNLLGCYVVLASGAQQDPLVPISAAITVASQDTVSVVLGGSDKIRT